MAKKLLSDLECSDAELSIVFVDDSEMQVLNRDYRNKDSTTDVLSFPQEAPEMLKAELELLGDVVISLPTAQRQAEELGHSLYYEVCRLLVHGVLHLRGYEHEDVDDSVAEVMFSREALLLQELAAAGLTTCE